MILFLVLALFVAIVLMNLNANRQVEDYYDSKRKEGTYGANPVDSADETAQTGCGWALILFAAILLFTALGGAAGVATIAEHGPDSVQLVDARGERIVCGWNFQCWAEAVQP